MKKILVNLIFLIYLFNCIAAKGLIHNERIVRGEKVEIQDVPWQVSIQSNGKHICGGTIVDGISIATAAYCVYNQTEAELTIRVGSKYHSRGGKIINVREITIHPDFNNNTRNNDISFLYLASELKFTDAIQPVALASYDPEPGIVGIVSGWGKTGENEDLSEELLAFNATIITREECNLLYNGLITQKMICARANNQDICQGDTGGPLIVTDAGIPYLYGIISWSEGCARPNKPGVYYNFSEFWHN